jgi:hypothetical protein
VASVAWALSPWGKDWRETSWSEPLPAAFLDDLVRTEEALFTGPPEEGISSGGAAIDGGVLTGARGERLRVGTLAGVKEDSRDRLVAVLLELAALGRKYGFGVESDGFQWSVFGEDGADAVSGRTFSYAYGGQSSSGGLQGKRRYLTASLALVQGANPAARVDWTLILDVPASQLRLIRRHSIQHPVRYRTLHRPPDSLTLHLF